MSSAVVGKKKWLSYSLISDLTTTLSLSPNILLVEVILLTPCFIWLLLMTWGKRKVESTNCLLSCHQFLPFLSVVVLNDSQILPGWLIKGKWREEKGSPAEFPLQANLPPAASPISTFILPLCLSIIVVHTSIPIAYRWIIISFCHHLKAVKEDRRRQSSWRRRRKYYWLCFFFIAILQSPLPQFPLYCRQPYNEHTCSSFRLSKSCKVQILLPLYCITHYYSLSLVEFWTKDTSLLSSASQSVSLILFLFLCNAAVIHLLVQLYCFFCAILRRRH